MNKPIPKKGIQRIYHAFLYSLSGLRTAIGGSAFRQEFCLYIVLLITLFFMPITIPFKCLLLLANTMVLIVELLNSSIEAVVDLASPDYHELAKRAKDMGSAATLVSITLAIILWGCAIYQIFLT